MGSSTGPTDEDGGAVAIPPHRPAAFIEGACAIRRRKRTERQIVHDAPRVSRRGSPDARDRDAREPASEKRRRLPPHRPARAQPRRPRHPHRRATLAPQNHTLIDSGGSTMTSEGKPPSTQLSPESLNLTSGELERAGKKTSKGFAKTPRTEVCPSSPQVAALYVAANGPYATRPGVDAWTIDRDARLYDGALPVLAHPPCERWGRFAEGPPGDKRWTLGDDGGCFAAALAAVRRVGGVIEHPQGSHAWRHFALPIPSGRGWTRPDAHGGRSCYVDQGAYGHRAKKPTWLYAVLPAFPRLDWTRVWDRPRVGGDGFHSAAERRKAMARPSYKPLEKMSKKERTLTPEPFARLMVELARSCAGWTPPGPRTSQTALPEVRA